MKPAATGTLSGIVVWFVVLGVAFMCLCPAAIVTGAVSTALGADSVAGLLEPYLCPEGSSSEIISYQTTSIDEFGNETPTTAYEMQCVGAGGAITRAPSANFAFYWMGALAAGGLIVSAGLAFLLAAPAGVLIGSIMRRRGQAETN